MAVTSELSGRDGRLTSIDVAKGVAIILVVYGHAARGLVEAGLLSGDGAIGAIDYVIYAMHMPLFFLLSGLFFEHSLAKGPQTFWKGRLLTIVYPYVLWSLVQGGVQVILSRSGAVNSPVGWDRLAEIAWIPISPFWFLYALFFANVILAATRRLPMPLILALALAAFLAAQLGLGAGTLVDVAYGFLYFTCGAAMARWRLLGRIPGSAGAILGLLALWIGLALAAQAAGLPFRLALPATAAGVAAALALSAAFAQLRLPAAVLSFLGQCSMAIFVMHILAIGAARLIALRFLGVDSALPLLLLLTFAGVLLPCVAQLVASRLGLARAFGLPDTARLREIARRPFGRLRLGA